ncbi:hypothetical protein CCAX7_14400 [Capsulimonas corticalis]|uniref:Uncharacterized protein n=1 Tax=Capsulimonas corticalis TaxID=2219043 RepID=A0A402D729_9BACT|nr:hypothetical protein [Capsulimonas corticalis]BDI29389.1 hypothetical protein CCAX7_14400 [Capsulimonas corticalis]
MAETWALDGSGYNYDGCYVSTVVYDKAVRNHGSFINLSPSVQDQVCSQILSRVAGIRHEIQGGGSFTEKDDGTAYSMSAAQSLAMAKINAKCGNIKWILNTFSAPSSIYPALANTPHHSKMIRPNGYGPVTSNNLSSPTSTQAKLWRDAIVKEIRALIAVGCNIYAIATPNEYSTNAIPADWWLAGGQTSSALVFANQVYGGQGIAADGVYPAGFGLKDIFPGLLLFNDDPNASGGGYLTGNQYVTLYGIHDYAQYGTAIKGKGNTPPLQYYGEFSCTSYANTVARLNQAFADDTMQVKTLSWWCTMRDLTLGSVTTPNGLTYSLNFSLYSLNANNQTVSASSTGGLYPFLALLQAQGKLGGYSYTDAATGGGISSRQPITGVVYVEGFHRNSDSKYVRKVSNTGGTAYVDSCAITLGGVGKPLSGTVRLFTSASEGAPSAVSTDGSGNLNYSVPAGAIAVYELS